MCSLQRLRRGIFITVLLAASVAPAHAIEPVTLFLLKMLRDHVASAMIESTIDRFSAAPTQPPLQSESLLGVYGVNEQQLRGLIDTGFAHLTLAQRDEVYDSLQRMLADPQYAAARPLIIQELAQKAAAVRGAHERLNALSAAEKRAIVADARAEYERLPPPERAQLLQVLQSRVVPIPRDLNDLILAEFSAAPLLAEAAGAAQ